MEPAVSSLAHQQHAEHQQGLEPIGVIRTQGGGGAKATAADLSMLGALLADNESLSPQTFCIINVAVGNADCTVNAAALTDAGVGWAMDHRNAPASVTPTAADAAHVAAAKVLVSDRVEGSCWSRPRAAGTTTFGRRAGARRTRCGRTCRSSSTTRSTGRCTSPTSCGR
jgi:hypothetical protein